LEPKQQPDVESALPEPCVDEVGAFFSVVSFLVGAMSQCADDKSVFASVNKTV